MKRPDIETPDFMVVRYGQGWGDLHIDRNVDNGPLAIAHQLYERGFGTHARVHQQNTTPNTPPASWSAPAVTSTTALANARARYISHSRQPKARCSSSRPRWLAVPLPSPSA